MSSVSAASSRPRQLPAPEVLLTIGALLTFLLIPIRINTIYSGLPAHPLFLHVPVILIPVAAIGALVLVARPSLFRRHGVWLGWLTVIALGATNLTMGAGKALRNDLHLNGGAIGGGGGVASLVARHSHAANMLRLLLIAFAAVFIIAVALYRHQAGGRSGIGFVDGISARLRAFTPSLAPLRLVVAVLALASLYFVVHTGDLGAKAVWQGRLGGAGASFGRPGSGFPGGGPAPGRLPPYGG